jgi:Spy/CpxP family protein refolding chaperone
MNRLSTALLRKAQLSVLALMLTSAAVYADHCYAANCPPASSSAPRPGEPIDRQLDHLAQLLKLQGTQQAGWQAFAKAEQMLHAPRRMTAENASIIEITADQADQAAIAAMRAEVVNQSTRKLWSILNAEQRTTLERVMLRGMMLEGPGPQRGPRGPGGPMD